MLPALDCLPRAFRLQWPYMARIVLISPPSPERLGGPLVGLQYVAAALLAHGCEVRVIDAAASSFAAGSDRIVEEVEGFAAEMVGLCLYTRWVRHAYELAERLRGRFPLLVAGGPHATACPDEVLSRGFDVAVLGEAEQAVTALAKCLDGTLRMEAVSGIRYRGASGGVFGDTPAHHETELDSLACPHSALPLFDSRWYGHSAWPPASHGIVSSRGCSARCTFCANYATGKHYRFRSAKNVVAEIRESWSLYGTAFFPFWDDALTANPGRLIDLCHAMQRDLPFAPQWSGTTRANMVEPELLSAMKRAGLCHLNFGVESGDDETLHSIRKGIRTDQVVKALESAREAGIRTSCNFMFGFPEETAAALERTLRFMERIAPLVDFFSPAGVLIPMPATLVYERNHKRYGFTEWWLKEEYGRPVERAKPASMEEACLSAANDPALDLDFFRYTEETRAMIRACLAFKADHNLRRMKEPDFPAGARP